MRNYLLASGVIFALITVAHIWRIVAERRSLMTEPLFVFMTLFAAAMSVWSMIVWRKMGRGTS